MTRPIKVALTCICLATTSLALAACGEEKISVPTSNKAAYSGAVLFSQRCAGCHTLSYAGTHGSASNIRDRQSINGPNFDQRCERPVSRVLYAIENGGFSGAYMPQNIVVGEQARQVAMFVSEFAGHQAAVQPGAIPCTKQPTGSLPPASASGVPVVTSAQPTTGTATTPPTPATGTATTPPAPATGTAPNSPATTPTPPSTTPAATPTTATSATPATSTKTKKSKKSKKK